MYSIYSDNLFHGITKKETEKIPLESSRLVRVYFDGAYIDAYQ